MIANLTCLKLRVDYFLAIIRTAFDQRYDLGRDRFHDALRLGLVTVPIIDVGDAAFLVVLNAVHGIAAEAERGNGRAVRAP